MKQLISIWRILNKPDKQQIEQKQENGKLLCMCKILYYTNYINYQEHLIFIDSHKAKKESKVKGENLGTIIQKTIHQN